MTADDMHIPKILVVDDEPDMELLLRQRFRRQIEGGQYNFAFARDGREALSRIQEDHEIEIVLSDINMPVMDGLTLLTHLESALGERVVKIIMVTAYGDMENIRTAMNRGAFDFITKPINFPDLQATIEKTVTQVRAMKDAFAARDRLHKLTQELRIASLIQRAILPASLPASKEYAFNARMLPAAEVGGDFYDCFPLHDGRMGFAIGDVSGKGVPAALYMAVTRTLLKATAVVETHPADCLAKVNRLLCAENTHSMFVTLFYGVLDPVSGEVAYCNAGHNIPIVLHRDGTLDTLENTWCIIAGVDAGAAYTEQQLHLRSGDRLLLYTDGVTEAVGKDDEMFSEHRLHDFLRSASATDSNTLLSDLIAAVATFSGPKQADDITTLLVEYHGA